MAHRTEIQKVSLPICDRLCGLCPAVDQEGRAEVIAPDRLRDAVLQSAQQILEGG